MKTMLVAAATLVLLVSPLQAADEDAAEEALVADIAAGEALYKKECRGCHGPTAKGLASFPKLVGQTAEYLADRVERYRAGEKFGPNTALMAPRAKRLDDQNIIDIAHFIASLE